MPGQRVASAQAVSSTQASIAGIRPISSATGMNSAGDSRPRAGWFQRSRASTPTTLPARKVDDRLIVDLELAAVARVAQLVLELAARLRRRVHLGSNRRKWLRPSALTR